MLHISPQTMQAFPIRVLVLSLSLPGQKDTSTSRYHIPPDFSRVCSSLLHFSLLEQGRGLPSPRHSQWLPFLLYLCLFASSSLKPEAPGSWKTCFDASDTLRTLSSLGGQNIWNFTELLLQHSFPEAIDAAKPRCLNHWLILQKIILPQCLFPSL